MDLLPFGEFNFGDMPDGPREPLRILKQGTTNRVGGQKLWHDMIFRVVTSVTSQSV